MGSGLTNISKFLSYVLRHQPEDIGLSVDEAGWASIEELISKAQRAGKSLDREQLHAVVKQGAKQRFELSNDHQFIRAGYGHSIDVDLQLHPKSPPEVLYHGTAEAHVSSILSDGLKAQNRNFVHLSAAKADAREVGSRHGKPIILQVQSAAMHHEEHPFYQSESEPGIWLVKYVPPDFLALL